MRNVKRWLSSLLCVAMLFSTLSVFGTVPKAKAVSTYDGEAGAAWGRANYKGKYNYSCATFASQCLNAGGFTDVYDAGCTSLRRKLLATGVFVEYPLEVTKQKIYPHSSANNGKVSVGDVLLVHKRGSSTYVHAYVAETVNDGPLYVVQTSLGDVYGSRHCWFDYNGNTTDYEIVSMHYTGKAPEPDPNRDELGCTTAYAGWYQETGSGGANVNSRHSKNWGDQVGVIAKGEYVYVSKATGTGSGNLGHILYNGVERYIAMGLFKRVNDRTGDPFGALDGCIPERGGFRLIGWALDWDAPYTALQINVYLDGELVLQGKADAQRTDLNQNIAGDIGDYHGYNLWVSTQKTGEHRYSVYAINEGAGSHVCIKEGTVNIPAADTEPPSLSDWKTFNVTSDGFDVSCVSTDNIGVNYVMVNVSTGEDSNKIGHSYIASKNGDVYTYHVNINDFENRRGKYYVQVISFDAAGNNRRNTDPMEVIVPEPDTEAPVISNVKVSNITTEGYDVSCTVTDNVGVNRVVFPTWTVLNDQDDMIKDWGSNPKTRGTQSGDTWTFHVNIADHNNERGAYLTHIYAFDDAGNHSAVGSEIGQIVVPEPYPTITFDACGGRAEFTEKQLERNADGMHYGALPEAWMDGYVFDGWYTDAVDGTRVSRTTAYTAEGNTTLYAHWTPVAADAEQGWSLQDGTLVITAQGAMQDYDSAAQTPWFKDRAEIRKIVVQQGVTTIGDYAFYGCENVTSVTLPDTVTQIGKLAFYGCKDLRTLTVPDSVLTVEDYAFAKAGLQTIVFRGSAPVLGAGIFAGLNAEVRYPAEAAGWTEEVRQSYTGSVNWLGVGAAALSAEESELQLEDPVLAALLADSCV